MRLTFICKIFQVDFDVRVSMKQIIMGKSWAAMSSCTIKIHIYNRGNERFTGLLHNNYVYLFHFVETKFTR